MDDRISILKGNITKVQVDAIVNAANSSLLGGGGVDGSIHKAAGPNLLEECKSLNGCSTGQAKITKGYDLHAKYVIHTVGPVWNGGRYDEDEYLAECYRNSFLLAEEHGVKSIAFPAISTGVYRFPYNRAAEIAVHEAEFFLRNNDVVEKVIFVCYDEETYEQYKKLQTEKV